MKYVGFGFVVFVCIGGGVWVEEDGIDVFVVGGECFVYFFVYGVECGGFE